MSKTTEHQIAVMQAAGARLRQGEGLPNDVVRYMAAAEWLAGYIEGIEPPRETLPNQQTPKSAGADDSIASLTKKKDQA